MDKINQDIELKRKYNLEDGLEDQYDLYNLMYNGNEVSFDLREGGNKVKFKMNKDYSIEVLNDFVRKLKF